MEYTKDTAPYIWEEDAKLSESPTVTKLKKKEIHL